MDAVASEDALVKITVYVPSLLFTTDPNVPAVVKTATFPPLDVKFTPAEVFN